VVTSLDLPGFITQAKNNKKLPEVISDAVLCYFDVPNSEGGLLHGKFKFGKMIYEFNTGEQAA